MRFIKMHGIGNDYVIVDCFKETVNNPEEVAVAISRRHYGVGSDGLILVGPSDVADLEMRIFNSDGSEAEMCGNGVRCAAKYAADYGLCRQKTVRVETLAGVKTVELTYKGGRAVSATVDMGVPGLTRAEIPMTGPGDERVIEEPLEVEGRELRVTCVSMGNPHCIIPEEKLERERALALGPKIENHPAFPERTNVHFVKVLGRDEVDVITWERGAGPTLACGTGASAVCVAMNLLDRTDRAITAHLPGGDLELRWAEDDHVHMSGPAEEVFTGRWEQK